MSNRQDMIKEANDLGLEFKGNISNIKLAALIAGDGVDTDGKPAPIKDDNPSPSPEVKKDDPKKDTQNDNPVDEKHMEVSQYFNPASAAMAKRTRRRKIVAAAKARAFKTHIVTITNKDNRENDVVTTAYLAFENQHFGLSKNVPLDIQVELEQSLIAIAANCTMTLHKDEIIDNKRTGNKIAITVKKYVISYSRQDPE